LFVAERLQEEHRPALPVVVVTAAEWFSDSLPCMLEVLGEINTALAWLCRTKAPTLSLMVAPVACADWMWRRRRRMPRGVFMSHHY
jgi:hypothetical protein